MKFIVRSCIQKTSICNWTFILAVNLSPLDVFLQILQQQGRDDKIRGTGTIPGHKRASVQLSPSPQYIYIYLSLYSSRTKRLVVSPRTIYHITLDNTRSISSQPAPCIHHDGLILFFILTKKKREGNKKKEEEKNFTSVTCRMRTTSFTCCLYYWKMNKVSSVEK